jgi:hypothetical protein
MEIDRSSISIICYYAKTNIMVMIYIYLVLLKKKKKKNKKKNRKNKTNYIIKIIQENDSIILIRKPKYETAKKVRNHVPWNLLGRSKQQFH